MIEGTTFSVGPMPFLLQYVKSLNILTQRTECSLSRSVLAQLCKQLFDNDNGIHFMQNQLTQSATLKTTVAW